MIVIWIWTIERSRYDTDWLVWCNVSRVSESIRYTTYTCLEASYRVMLILELCSLSTNTKCTLNFSVSWRGKTWSWQSCWNGTPRESQAQIFKCFHIGTYLHFWAKRWEVVMRLVILQEFSETVIQTFWLQRGINLDCSQVVTQHWLVWLLIYCDLHTMDTWDNELRENFRVSTLQHLFRYYYYYPGENDQYLKLQWHFSN